MGFYIETDEPKNKAVQLARKYEVMLSEQAPTEEEFQKLQEMAPNLALVCVVDNGPFEAAGYVYNERELQAFTSPGDYRPKIWLIMNKKVVEELTGYEDEGPEEVSL